jgi:hypothetical protein
MSNNNPEELQDITIILREASQTLSDSSPLLCDDDSFRLQEIMQALEVMHPIMDKCDVPASVYSCPLELMWRQDTDRIKDFINDVKVPPRKPPTGLDDKMSTLPWETLSCRDARIITLEHLIRLESFLSGSDILESVYTSLYAHDDVLRDMKQRLEHSGQLDSALATVPVSSQWAVFASTLMLVKLAEMVKSIIINADIHEEEDFSYFSDGNTQTFFSTMTSEEEVRNIVKHTVTLLSTSNLVDDKDALITKRCLEFQLCLHLACSLMVRSNLILRFRSFCY